MVSDCALPLRACLQVQMSIQLKNNREPDNQQAKVIAPKIHNV